MATRSGPGLNSLIVASIGTVILSFVPFANILTYPFLIFSTFIHESSHALAAILTLGRVDSITIAPDGSGLTYSAGGIRFIVASAGYLGTALFGGLLLVLSRGIRLVRPVLLSCAVLVGLVTVLFVGYASNVLVLCTLAIVISLFAFSIRRKSGILYQPLIAGSLLLVLLAAYLFLTGSLFSWAVGLLMTSGLLAVALFTSQPVAHFFLSFLAVQCSLNALQGLRALWSLSTNSCVHTDAQTLAGLTGLPPWFWAGVWILQALLILAIALWLFQRPERQSSVA